MSWNEHRQEQDESICNIYIISIQFKNTFLYSQREMKSCNPYYVTFFRVAVEALGCGITSVNNSHQLSDFVTKFINFSDWKNPYQSKPELAGQAF